MSIKCSTSLWSADLTNLAAELKRVEPYSDAFHLDVADGHYVKNLIFFPDLVAAMRTQTSLPFEVHLITFKPESWVEPFAQAGADILMFYLDACENPWKVIEAIHACGKKAAISLRIEDPIDLLEPYWQDISVVAILGTYMGTKGASMHSCVPDKISLARRIVQERGLKTEIMADGGIRRETVPVLAQAGVDWIVPGSLYFKDDPKSVRAWLETF